VIPKIGNDHRQESALDLKIMLNSHILRAPNIGSSSPHAKGKVRLHFSTESADFLFPRLFGAQLAGA
jgi:hypothetical protein